MHIIETRGGDFSVRNAKRINENFAEIVGINGLVWDDLRFPASGINPQGRVTDPDLEETDPFMGALLFPSNRIAVVAGIAQFPHAKAYDTDIRPHVHWTPTSGGTGNVLWRLEYMFANPFDTFSDSLITMDILQTADAEDVHQIANFGSIDTTGLTASAIMMWKISRVGTNGTDTYGDDARLLEFDIHYQIDSLGSVDEFIK